MILHGAQAFFHVITIQISGSFNCERERKVLDSLMAKNFHHVVLLSGKYTDDVQQSDANTLITLLHLRDIAEKTDYVFNTASEILDNRNHQLAEVAKVNDFIISEKIISLMLAQISETKISGRCSIIFSTPTVRKFTWSPR